jgi:hypothetical protein
MLTEIVVLDLVLEILAPPASLWSSQPSIFENGMPTSVDLAKMNSKFLPAILVQTLGVLTSGTGWDYFGNLLIPTRSTYFLNYIEVLSHRLPTIDK